MNLTKVKLQSGDITKFEFMDFAVNNKETSSGFLKITLERKEQVELSTNDLLLFFTGLITAFKGEETIAPDDNKRVLNLEVNFTLKYTGEFDLEETPKKSEEFEWFFKKDAGIFLHGIANNFLSNTAYRSISFPYQQ